MIKLAVLLVCVSISYAEPQRQNFYLPVQFSKQQGVGSSYHYVPVVQQPFLRPVNRIPIVATNRLPSPSYPTLVRLPLPALTPNRPQFRLPPGGYFIVPASALHGHQQASSVQTGQRFFRPIVLPTVAQVRPNFAATTTEEDECQDDPVDHESTEEIEEKK